MDEINKNLAKAFNITDDNAKILGGALRERGQQGAIPVDTLNRQADPNVKRGVEIVNNAQTTAPSPMLTADAAQAIATPPPVETPLSEADQTRNALRDAATDILGTDITAQRQQARQDAGVIEKEERSRQLSNQLIARDREIQRQRERLEENLRADSRGGLESQLAKFNRESARELADLSFSYQVALGDYTAAEKIASDYISDFQANLTNKQNAWQMLYTLMQNDMTESEKLQANQAFQEKQMQDQFELNKKLATFNQQLQQNDPKYQLEVANLRSQMAQASVAAQEKRDLDLYNKIQSAEVKTDVVERSLSTLDNILKNQSGLQASVGSTILGRLPFGLSTKMGVGAVGVKPVFGDKADFLADVSYVVNNLTFDKLKELKAGGATFGALSDKELKSIGDASSVLASMSIKNKEGQITGFKGTEKKAIEQIQLIQQKLQKEKDSIGMELLSPSEFLQINNL
jgi:hypothetical protein